MINENTYERITSGIRDAAERVTLRLIGLQAAFARKIAKQPDLYSRYRQEFNQGRQKVMNAWGKDIQTFLNNDLPESYILGVKDADARIKRLGVTVSPTGTIPYRQPMAAGIHGTGFIPDGTRRLFAMNGITNHLTAFSVFRGAAHRELEGTLRPILRSTDDVIRRLIIETGEATFRESAITTRVSMLSDIMQRAADNGVTGVVYKGGRRVPIDVYGEMAGRTLAGKSSAQATMNRGAEFGSDLIQISEHQDPSPLCAPYQGRVFSVSGNSDQYPPFQTALDGGLYHPNCVVGDTNLRADNVISAYKRWYEGEVIVISVALGYKLTITPNHPILTTRGWVPAGRLNEGDKIINNDSFKGVVPRIDPDKIQVESTAEQVFASLRESFPMNTRKVPISSEDFHGDGTNEHVDIVRTNSGLRNMANSSIIEPLGEKELILTNTQFAKLSSLSAFALFFNGHLSSLGCIISSRGKPLPLFHGHSTETHFHGLASVLSTGYSGDLQFSDKNVLGYAQTLSNTFFGFSGQISLLNFLMIQGYSFRPFTSVYSTPEIGEANAGLMEALLKSGLTNTEILSDLIYGEAGHIKINGITNIDRFDYSGHVYNIETVSNWYIANNIVIHNCKHSVDTYWPGVAEPATRSVDPAVQKLYNEMGERQGELFAYKQTQRQRQIENTIRKYKRREAGALTGADRSKAGRKVAEWQGKQRELLDEHSFLRRRYDREQIK